MAAAAAAAATITLTCVIRREPKCELLKGSKAEVVPSNDAVQNESKVHEARGRVRRSKQDQQI